MKRNGMDDSLVGAVLGISSDDVRSLVYESDPAVDLSAAPAVGIVTLDDAQIRALPATPVEVVPAPGPGKCLYAPAVAVGGGMLVSYDWHDDYDNLDSFARLYLGYQLGPEWEEPFGRWGQVGDVLGWGEEAEVLWFPGSHDSDNATVLGAQVEDKPLELWLNNEESGDALTGGDAANELRVQVQYVTLDI